MWVSFVANSGYKGPPLSFYAVTAYMFTYIVANNFEGIPKYMIILQQITMYTATNPQVLLFLLSYSEVKSVHE